MTKNPLLSCHMVISLLQDLRIDNMDIALYMTQNLLLRIIVIVLSNVSVDKAHLTVRVYFRLLAQVNGLGSIHHA